MPKRNQRVPMIATGRIGTRARNAKYAEDEGPIGPGCDCYACRSFSRGAIRHFYLAGEMTGPVLASLHNIRFFQRLMADLRRAIEEGTLEELRRSDPRARLAQPDAGPRPPHRPIPRARWDAAGEADTDDQRPRAEAAHHATED